MSQHGTRRRSGVTAIALLLILVIGIVSFVLVYFGPRLCIGCPTTVQYNPTASTHTIKVVTPTAALNSYTLTGGPVSWPIGSAGTTFTVSGPLGPFGTWLVTLPADQSVGTSSSYVFTSSYSGTAFLNAANNAGLWTAEGPSINNQNPFVFNSTFTSSVPGAACNTASTTNVCKVTWYLDRYYFTVDMTTAGAGLYIACQGTCQGYSCFFGQLCNNAVYDAAFQQGFLSALATVNSVTHLSSGTSLSLQLNLPPLPGGQSNVDFAGIVAAWTATPCTGGSATPQGGGTGSNDLCVTNTGSPAGASIVQSAVHTPLTLFTDSGATNKYLPAFSPFFGVSTYTASQLASLTPASLLPTVYTKIDISDFGAGFSQGPNYSSCGISNFRACWTVTQPEAVVTVLLDVLTSIHVYKQYPTPAPQTGTSAGSIDGQVVDGSLFWHPNVPGATICLTDITGCVPADGNGNFLMTNVPAGQHTIQISAPSFVTTAPLSVSVSTGSTFHEGQISLAEQNPWYTGNYCPVAPQYIPGTNTQVPGTFAICIPWILIFTLIGAGVLAVAVVAFIYSPGAKVDAAAQIARRLTPTNPLSPRAQRFVSNRIAREIRRGHPPKQAQAIAFSKARQRGFHVPPKE